MNDSTATGIGQTLTATGVFEATFTRLVIASIVLVTIVIALKSDKVKDGAKVLLGILAGLVAIVAAYAIGYAVGFASAGDIEAVRP